MSPIFVRPVREQLEHDRLIRQLQARYKKKYETAANVGDEQTAPVKIGANTFYPDLVLTAGKKLAGLVEVESGESVNNLEAMAQWVHFSRVRAPFYLYVPVHVFDVARRLCAANNVKVSEIWTYRPAMDGFDLVRMFHDGSVSPAPAERSMPVKIKPAPPPAPPAPAPPPAPVKTTKPPAAKLPVPTAKSAPVPKSAPAKSAPVSKPAPAAKSAPAKPAPAKKTARAAKPAKPAKKAPKASKSKRAR